MSAQEYTATADYLVASVPRNSSIGDRVTVARRAVETAEAQGEGFDRKTARWYGYEGWQIGKVFFGEREDGFLLRATGPIADHVAFTLPCTDLSIARIDLAVTVWYQEDATMVAKERHVAATVSRETRQAPGRLKIRLQDGTGDGDTLYLGSRSSQVFGRVYDKWRASREEFYRHSWRWELQIKDRTADKVYRAIDGEEDRPAAIGSSVAAWFQARGVDCPAADPGGTVVSIRAPCERSDMNKRLDWLRRQVRPVIARLLKEGHEDAILDALGLVGRIAVADKEPGDPNLLKAK